MREKPSQSELALLWLSDLQHFTRPRNIKSYVAIKMIRARMFLALLLGLGNNVI